MKKQWRPFYNRSDIGILDTFKKIRPNSSFDCRRFSTFDRPNIIWCPLLNKSRSKGACQAQGKTEEPEYIGDDRRSRWDIQIGQRNVELSGVRDGGQLLRYMIQQQYGHCGRIWRESFVALDDKSCHHRREKSSLFQGCQFLWCATSW